MFALDRAERSVLAGAAVAALLAAVAFAPSRAGNTVASSVPESDLASHMGHLTTDVPVVRDPFGPDADEAPTPAASGLPRLMPLPPNAGAGPFPFAAGTPSLRVLAVVEGPQPRALVDEGGRSRIVGAGDRFAGRHVVLVDAGGLTLDDGRRLSIDTEHYP